MSNNNIIGAGGIIFDPIHQTLLVVKGFEKWSLPKGHREPGETLYQTAMREIYEETSIRLYLTPWTCSKRILKCIYYLILIPNGQNFLVEPIDKNEVTEVKWYSYQQLLTLNGNKQLRYLLRNWNQIIPSGTLLTNLTFPFPRDPEPLTYPLYIRGPC
jgi:8-oxo-dGTP pyrophosphatase MutT (NUDIX family)